MKKHIGWLWRDGAYCGEKHGEYYLAADVDARIAKLEKAFKWVLQNEVWFDRYSNRFYEYMGQGELEAREAPPEVLATVSGLMNLI